MSDDDWKRDAAFVVVMMVGVFITGAHFGYYSAVNACHQEAVDKGHAEYDRKTTEFRWLDVAEVPE